MRPYSLSVIAFCAVGTVMFAACNSAGSTKGGTFIGGSTTTISNQAQSPSAQTTAFQPIANGPSTAGGVSVTIPHLLLGAAAFGLSGGAILDGPGAATFNGLSFMKFVPDTGTPTLAIYQAMPQSFSDGLIAWGRWTYNPNEPASSQSLYNINGAAGPVGGGSFSYVLGAPTPIANLPQSGTATYSLIGATIPTSDDPNNFANERNRFVAGALSVLWGSATAKIGVDFTVLGGGGVNTFQATSTGGLANPSQSQISLTPGTATFAGTLATTASTPVTCFGGPCTTSIDGFFVGQNAERAGLAYVVNVNAGSDALYGTAAFTAGASTGSSTGLLSQTNPVNVTVSGGPSNPAFLVSNNGSIAQNPDLSLSIINVSSGVATYTSGSTSSTEVGSDGIITWGRWLNGTPGGSVFGSPPNALTGTASLHYIAGVPTAPSALPASGTATFTLLGATSPTFGNGVGGTGTVTGGTLSVLWGGSATTKVGMDLSLTMPSDAIYRIVTTGGLMTPSTSEISIQSGSSLFSGNIAMPSTGRACTGSACTANVSGFFAGATAQRAGVAYSITNAVPSNGVFGVAAFTR
ncbi:MAG TPA: hypothetical protein VKS43_09155 [Burkholderiales bacterium]|nr:hypothetical protein [Burkholderiales bacterium]